MTGANDMQMRQAGAPILLSVGLAFGLLCSSVAPVLAEGGENTDAINQRLYQQLGATPSQSKIETVSGQMYIAKENLDASVISDALAALLDGQRTEGESVSVQRAPRVNFEIHFKKNSANLTEESHTSLDELAKVLGSDFADMRFVLGGHTDQDGDEAVNLPLSQARAESARAYLVKQHSIAPDRLVARGFGANEPLREVETSAKDKLYNRRVDLRPLR